jgi:DNA invertase Pin-like site-specific DNA recombinase
MKEKLIHREAFNYYFLLGNIVPIKSKKDMREKRGIKRGSQLDNILNGKNSIAGKRSLQKVAREFNVSRTAVYNWYYDFKWEKRARERDQEINRKMRETSNEK